MASSSLNDGMKSLSFDDGYIISAAIDFGTTFSGYAFSFKSKPNDIHMNKNWGSELGCDSYKAPTCVMTNPDGSFHSFGYTAEHEYNQLDPEEDEIGGLNGYNLYRHFKMLLHNVGVTMSSTVISTSGHIRPAIDIFAMVLKFLKEHMMDPIKKAQTTAPSISDMRWVLTVPAIWSDESKGFMREAAYRAGLIPEKNSTRLIIALEPEAASIFCRSLEVNSFAGSDSDTTDHLTFRSGEKLLIIDAGGGTVDITAHEILIDGKVKEILSPSGGSWGGIKVDEKFVTMVVKMFGSDFVNKFKTERPQQWLQLMLTFEKAKRSFTPGKKCTMKIPVPYDFGKDLLKMKHLELEEIVAKSSEKGIRFSNGCIVVKHEKGKDFFSENVTQIKDHVTTLLAQRKLKNLNYIMLVGGFGECQTLQEACQSAFSDMARVLIPVDAQLAIIKGAILFGHNPLQVSSRVARHTYGIGLRRPFCEGQHNPSKRYIDNDGTHWCTNLFQVLVTKGETIETGTTKVDYFCRNKSDTYVYFTLHKTDKPGVTYTDEPGVKEVGSVRLNLPSEDIVVKTTFGHTELLFEAWEKIKGNSNPVRITVDFLSA